MKHATVIEFFLFFSKSPDSSCKSTPPGYEQLMVAGNGKGVFVGTPMRDAPNEREREMTSDISYQQ